MSFSEPEPLPSGTVLAYARQKPILHEERLICASFGDCLAFGEARERDGAQLVRWKLGLEAVELEVTEPRAQALSVEVLACVEKTERLISLLRSALEKSDDPVLIGSDVAGEFGPQLMLRRDIDLTRGVSLDRRSVEHQREVLSKTIQTLRWALRKPRVVSDAGRLRLIGWGYCPPTERPKDHAMVPLRLKHSVEGVGDEARIVFHWEGHPSFTGAFVLKEKVAPNPEFQPIADAPPGSVSVRIPFRAEVHTGRYFITTTNVAGSHSSNTVEVNARRPSAPPPPPEPRANPEPRPEPEPRQEPEPRPRNPEPSLADVPPAPLQAPLLQVRAAPDQSKHLEVEWSPPAGLDAAGVRTEVEYEESEGTWISLVGDQGATGKHVDPQSDLATSRSYRARHVTDTEVSAWSTATWTARKGCGCWPFGIPPSGCVPKGCGGGCLAWLMSLPGWLALLLLLLAGSALLALLSSILGLLGSLFGFALPSWMTLFAGVPDIGLPTGPDVVVETDSRGDSNLPTGTRQTSEHSDTQRTTDGSRTSNDAELATGEVQLTLRWSTKDDLDLIGRAPSRQPVWFQQPRAANGFLDRDDNRDHSNPAPVENICWTSPCDRGTYEVFVKHWSADPLAGGAAPVPFALTIKSGPDIRTINGSIEPGALRSVRFDYPASGDLPSDLGATQAESVPIPEAPKASGAVRSGVFVPRAGDPVAGVTSPEALSSGEALLSSPSLPLPRGTDPSGAREVVIVPAPVPGSQPEPPVSGDRPRSATDGRTGEAVGADRTDERRPQAPGETPESRVSGPQVVSTAASDVIPHLIELFAHARGSRWDFKQDDGGTFFHLESEEGSLEFGVSIWVDLAAHPGVDPEWDRNLNSEAAQRFGVSLGAPGLHTSASADAYPKARWVNLRLEERPRVFGQLALSDLAGPSGITVHRQRRHVEVLGAPAVWWVAYRQAPRDPVARQLEWWINRKSTPQSSDFHWTENLAGYASLQVVVPEPLRMEAQLNLKGDRGEGIKTEVAHTGVFWLEILKR